MPDLQNPFRGGAGRATPQQMRVTQAEQELARARAASAEARGFKQGVLAEREAMAARGTGKGSRLTQRAHAELEAWRAKNQFADENFKLRRQQEAVARAELGYAKAARETARAEKGPWMGRAASVKRLEASREESRAIDKLTTQEARLERYRQATVESFRNWREQNPRARRTPTM